MASDGLDAAESACVSRQDVQMQIRRHTYNSKFALLYSLVARFIPNAIFAGRDVHALFFTIHHNILGSFLYDYSLWRTLWHD